MNDIDEKLPLVLSSMIFESINNPDFSIEDWEPKIKALFHSGVCADCKYIGYCSIEFMGKDDIDKCYCSEFEGYSDEIK